MLLHLGAVMFNSTRLVGHPQSAGEWSRSLRWGMLFIIVAMGAWLRFHNLSVDSLWHDEAYSWHQSKDSIFDVVRRTAEDTYPPLNNLFLYASIKLFGDQEWALRLPSAIFGTANILAIYWLGSITVGRVAALMAAALLTLSGFHVWYSQEARMYALLSLTATLFVASSFYFVRSPNIPRAIFVSLSGLALLYSHRRKRAADHGRRNRQASLRSIPQSGRQDFRLRMDVGYCIGADRRHDRGHRRKARKGNVRRMRNGNEAKTAQVGSFPSSWSWPRQRNRYRVKMSRHPSCRG